MILNNDQLQQRARSFAMAGEANAEVSKVKPNWRVFRDDVDYLRRFATLLSNGRANCTQPAEDWLLDHIDFIEKQALEVMQQLPRPVLHQLPRYAVTGEPRIYSLCRDYLEQVDGQYNSQSFAHYVNAFQEVSVLKLMECWSLPSALRVVYIRMFAQKMREVERRHQVCLSIASWFQGMNPASVTTERILRVLERETRGRTLSATETVHLILHFSEWDADMRVVREWLALHVENGLDSLTELASVEHQVQSELQVTCGHLVQGLHQLERLPWRLMFGEISKVEQLLQTDCTHVYERMDEASQNTLRRQVERLAKRLRVPETLVASTAIQLATSAHSQQHRTQEAPKRCDIAYYLLQVEGMEELRTAFCSFASPRKFPHLQVRKRAFSVYMASLTVWFVLFLIIAARLVASGTHGIWPYIAVIAALAIPTSEWSVQLVHTAILKGCRSRGLLRFDYSGAVPEEARTIVVIPVLWSTLAEVDELVQRLEVHYLANRQENLHFGILADLADAQTATHASDATIVAHAVQLIRELGEKYGQDKFFLLHRERRQNDVEGIYMGWERKRGKLVEFVELLSGSEKTSFTTVVGDTNLLPEIKYVFTVDADTRLPIGVVSRLVGTMHLPYNRPRLNEQGTRVVEGYGVLQPRIGVNYESTQASRLAKLWAGSPGIDVYAFAASDPYQDWFSEAIFVGKGIFDVEMFRRTLVDRIPDNQVLSHDLLEGGFLRAGLAADIEVVDDYPATFYSHQRRAHRWIRGDFQLLRWLGRSCPTRVGRQADIDLCKLTKWQIVDNLRRGILTPTLFIVSLLALTVLPGRPMMWQGMIVITLFFPFLQTMITQLFNGQRVNGIWVSFLQSTIRLVTLPYDAVLALDAVLRTIYRMSISRRKLLEWTPSAEIYRKRTTDSRLFVNGSLTVCAIGAYLVLAWLFGSVVARTFAVVMGVIWILVARAVVSTLNRPVARPSKQWLESARPQLTELAQYIWTFYDQYVTANESWLPPDNVQYHPQEIVAHRTSPTNIGLYLACALSAHELGLIGLTDMLKRLEDTTETLTRMEKWEGHLLNWYDTITAAPLLPRYVSTVDSGNLVAYLMMVVQGLSAKRAQHPAQAERISQLMKTMDDLVEASNFTALYHSDSELLTLGYHLDSQRHETILYDLMASEARQASFVGIALGQIPISHWFALGRTMVLSGKHKTLLSWSGTMFEYLMPWLLLRTYPGTVWESTYQGVVARQREYAKQRQVPFGISESGYYAFDYQLNYQYRAFGVPGLGFDRGHDKQLVIAPYATILALPYAGKSGLDALAELERIGAKGRYGYYEAVDFTTSRLPKGHRQEVVQSFMAHHQGMSLLTIANLLHDGLTTEYFHADRRVQATELILQERVPAKAALLKQPLGLNINPPEIGASADDTERIYPERTVLPEVNVLSNGHLTSMTSNDGAGFLKWNGLAVTRWREDPVVDNYGPAIYVHDVDAETLMSPVRYPCDNLSEVGQQPRYEAAFRLDKTRFSATTNGLLMTLDVTVASDADAEVRCLSLTNLANVSRSVEVTSFMELALATAGADNAHPAFSKLFVETSYDMSARCLLAKRRPREEPSEEAWAGQVMYTENGQPGEVEFETDRAAFVGRGHSLAYPQATHLRLRGTVGSVADPAFVIRRTIRVGIHQTVKVYIVTALADSRNEVVATLAKLSEPDQAKRAFELAWVRTQIDLRHLHLSPDQAVTAHALAARLLYTPPLGRYRTEAIVKNVLGQTSLWAHGIGGDSPVLTVRIAQLADLPFVTLLLRQHQYLCLQGLDIDLVVLDESDGGYLDETMHQLRESLAAKGISDIKRMIGLKKSALSPEELTLLFAVSRVVLRANGPSLPAQLHVADNSYVRADALEKSVAENHTFAKSQRVLKRPSTRKMVHGGTESIPTEGEFYNGFGSFIDDGKAYQMKVTPGHQLPRPWTNVIANPKFGTLVTELGTGYTWWKNSRECKLTPWSNDAVLDVPGECLYLRDTTTNEVWSAAPKPAGDDRAYIVTHGQGYSQIDSHDGDIAHAMETCVPLEDPVKLIRLRITNRSAESKQVALTYYVEWVLGTLRFAEAPYILTEWDAKTETLLAKNNYQTSFRDAVGFLHMTVPDHAPTVDGSKTSYAGDRMAFIGRGRNLSNPLMLHHPRLSNHCGSFANSCGAVQRVLQLAADETKEVVILFGCATSQSEAIALVEKYRPYEAYESVRAQITEYWDGLLGQMEVKTPDRSMDILLNRWLMYQTLACRIWARTAFYQAGGAFGFRDQLQDSLALLHADENIPRMQILHNAAHQYREGDVQHWWHDETGKGIRTKFSDDLLWLPYAVSRYVEQTGDLTILDEQVPFLVSELLRSEEIERYEDTVVSDEVGSIFEHCVRAVEHAMGFGKHGIPLMGSGDWNDGMSRVGAEGRGESVWLGWFMLDILKRFLALGEVKLGAARVQQYESVITKLSTNLNSTAWDGAWFRRAFTDAGTWLGSLEDTECRIDAIAQSWSVISEGTTPERQARAMRSFDRELVDRELSLAKLLTPAFDKTVPSPGYIQGYPPGIRENGGQYTHGVIWGIMAWAMLDRRDKAHELFQLLNPIHHTRTLREVLTYAGEPYVMSADIYTANPHQGRAGWSWYTGAAGWMYQAGIEYILGIKRRGEVLYIHPCVPESWEEFSFSYRYGKTDYRVQVDCRRTLGPSAEGEDLVGEGVSPNTGAGRTGSASSWTLDGKVLPVSDGLLLVDDGHPHEVQVRVGQLGNQLSVG